MVPAFGSVGNDSFTYRGAAAADFNNDGWIDLFVCGVDRNYLYLNDGHGLFRDASKEAGLEFVPPCIGVVAFDYDNDGDTDVFLTNVGPQMLLRNRLKEDGHLLFADVSDEAHVSRDAIAFSAAVGDVNGDGLPDVYVTSYNYYGKVVPNSWFNATNGTANLLFINQGDGTFKEEAHQWGVDDQRWSYAAEFSDVNGDGKLDLYVVNDFGDKALFINKGDHFEDEATARGVLDPGNGMGVSFGDFNNDGLLDLHVTNMSSTAGNRILTRLFPQVFGKGKRAEEACRRQQPLPKHGEWPVQGRDRGRGWSLGRLGLGRWFHRLRQRWLERPLHAQRLHLRQVDEGHLKPVLASGRDAEQHPESHRHVAQ